MCLLIKDTKEVFCAYQVFPIFNPPLALGQASDCSQWKC